jgi:hypothetical protein
MESIILNHEHFVQRKTTIYKHLDPFKVCTYPTCTHNLWKDKFKVGKICPMDEELEMK